MSKYWIEVDGYRYDLAKKWIPCKETHQEEFDEYGHMRIKKKSVKPAVFSFEKYSTKDKPTLEYILKRFSSFKCCGDTEPFPLTFIYDGIFSSDGDEILFPKGNFVR